MLNGVESVTFFPEREREPFPRRTREATGQPFICAAGLLDGADDFDASYFEIPPREAELIDPQQRVFLEVRGERARERRVRSRAVRGAIGVFGGCGANTYLLAGRVATRAHRAASGFHALILGQRQGLPGDARVASSSTCAARACTVQTACSTSLVAVHIAVSEPAQRRVRRGARRRRLAGASRRGPATSTCRAASLRPTGTAGRSTRAAAGTVGGSGVGMVVLKRLDDALARRRSRSTPSSAAPPSTTTAKKVSFTAPGAGRQAAVIAEAHDIAGVRPASIGYVETHGTGTAARRSDRDRGAHRGVPAAHRADAHLRPRHAEGQHRSPRRGGRRGGPHQGRPRRAGRGRSRRACNFETPNPHIEFATSPFFLPTSRQPWARAAEPRRAGVSSFGIGGTNAHVVLEEPPPAPARWRPGVARIACCPCLGASERSGAPRREGALAARLESARTLDLADVAFTLQLGRRAHGHRRAVVAADVDEAVAALRAPSEQRTRRGRRRGVPLSGTALAAARRGRKAPRVRARVSQALRYVRGHRARPGGARFAANRVRDRRRRRGEPAVHRARTACDLRDRIRSRAALDVVGRAACGDDRVTASANGSRPASRVWWSCPTR